ncbi:hypothetical protein SAMN05192588_1204 [Nonlabens sp. Hel1_33_55]|uniref:hypothetical protein n=1 Tax=Nonlabens sp. Hel1_33_55 TaxID=1336802 RepID=UPI000875BA44|nr:hypothetical protein [Nonlabens sp. Hel1_33_55]SCY11205.1 hypothetical protein SAMN05192588_1204 [Nonlabens sp. Hel1_33_55]
MKNILTLLLITVLVSCNKPSEKNQQEVSQSETEATIDKKKFPEDFLGIYKGDLKITSSNGEQSIPMEFHMNKTDSIDNFKYTIYYGEERSPRNYNLKRTHNPNLFLVDENNGIILESAYANHTLYSTYEVANNLLNSTEIFYDDRMEFMIALSRIQDTSMTGKEESAIVKNYPLSVMQRATLYKQ